MKKEVYIVKYLYMDFTGFEKLSLVDYKDKLSCTLFMEGCNFRCPFCHNSELVLSLNKCNKIPFEEILKYLKKRKGLLDAVCISGGEPTLMPDLKEKIKIIKNLGYLVKLDTNGTNPKILKELIDENLIDYCAMDIKNSKAKYDVTIGTKYNNFKNIEESIKILMNNKIPYEFRTTLVDEFHDKESIKELGSLIKGANILYLQHFVASSNCIKQGLHEVNKKKAEEYKIILLDYIKEVELRGY